MNKRYTSTQFLDVINNHKLSNVYFIYGEDQFLSDKIIKQLINKFTTQEGREFDLVSLFAEEIRSMDHRTIRDVPLSI